MNFIGDVSVGKEDVVNLEKNLGRKDVITNIRRNFQHF